MSAQGELKVAEVVEKYHDLIATIEAAKHEIQMLASEPYIGKEAAAEYLNISVTTLERRMALPDGPPRYVDGGRVSFLRSELRVWRRQWRAGDQTGLPEPKA